MYVILYTRAGIANYTVYTLRAYTHEVTHYIIYNIYTTLENRLRGNVTGP